MKKLEQGGERRNQPPREIFVRREFWNFIESGAKTLELRIAFANFKDIKPQHKVEFKKGDGQGVVVEVEAVRTYTSLEEAMEHEDIGRLAPGVDPSKALALAKALFKQDDIQKYGLMVIEFHKIEKE